MDRRIYTILFLLILFSNSVFSSGESLSEVTGYLVDTSSTRLVIDPGIRVLYGTYNGLTTDFLFLNDSALASISNMTLENSKFGKIVFDGLINLNVSVDWNNEVDLDGFTNISFNRIYVDSNILTALDSSAIIHLYNLTFLDPIILRDGVLCTSCTKLSYSAGNFIFSAPGFSEYRLQESSTSQSTNGGSGGGGSGSGSLSKKTIPADFNLNTDLIKLVLKQGQTTREIIEITNNQVGQNIDINLDGLSSFLILSETNFHLGPGETKRIFADFYSRENQSADVYFGRIKVNGVEFSKIINVILDIQEKEPLFDISVIVGDSYFVGEDLVANITIVNMGDLYNFDILVHYAIKDLFGTTMTFSEESIAIIDKLDLVRSLRLPAISPGDYVFYVKISGEGATAVGSDLFTVNSEEFVDSSIISSSTAFLTGWSVIKNLTHPSVWLLFLITILILIFVYLIKRKNS